MRTLCFFFLAAGGFTLTSAPGSGAEKQVDRKLSPSLEQIAEAPGLPNGLRGTLASEPRISLVEPRVWSCDFDSRALDKSMRFLVVLPESTTLASAPLPAI